MKPHICRIWNGGEQQWGWAVTKGWFTVWDTDIREAWKKWRNMTC